VLEKYDCKQWLFALKCSDFIKQVKGEPIFWMHNCWNIKRRSSPVGRSNVGWRTFTECAAISCPPAVMCDRLREYIAVVMCLTFIQGVAIFLDASI
jgi:hypothetical protein